MGSTCIISLWSTFTASKVCAGSYDYAQVECVSTPGAPTNNICILCILMYYFWNGVNTNGYKLKKVLPSN